MFPSPNNSITKTIASASATQIENQKRLGLVCPNCGGELQGRKCKLFCTKSGCGYLVTCSEW